MLLLLSACFTSLNAFSTYPELTELNYDNYEIDNWMPHGGVVYPNLKRPTLGVDLRSAWQPEAGSLINRCILTARSIKLNSYPDITVNAYQKMIEGEEPLNRWQANLHTGRHRVLKHFTLGSFRMQAGEGLCLGSYFPYDKGGISLISPSQGLSHPNLTGAALQVEKFKVNLAAWLSQTERYALLEEGRIIRLYESGLISDSDKDRIQEQTGGLIAAYAKDDLELGGYLYSQSYNRAWADTTLQSFKQTAGLFGSYAYKVNQLRLEACLLKDKVAGTVQYRFFHPNFNQRLSYYYRPETIPLSYARTRQIFGQQVGVEECSWDAGFSFNTHYYLTGRIAAVRDLTGKADNSWKERLILTGMWQQTGTKVRLSYYQYRKDIFTYSDSLSSDLLPLQKRLRADWEKTLARGIKYNLACQYQHYLDRKISKNGFSLQHSVTYGRLRSDYKLTFIGWVNQKSSYQPSELLQDDELLLQADSDSALRLTAAWKLSRALKLGLNAYHPFGKARLRSYRASLQTAF